MSTVKIKYVGLKELERAFFELTGLEWHQGSVQDVSAAHATQMLKHPDVFELVEVRGLAAAKPKAVEALPEAKDEASVEVPATATTTPAVDLEALTKEELHEMAKAKGVSVKWNASAENVRKALIEAAAK